MASAAGRDFRNDHVDRPLIPINNLRYEKRYPFYILTILASFFNAELSISFPVSKSIHLFGCEMEE